MLPLCEREATQFEEKANCDTCAEANPNADVNVKMICDRGGSVVGFAAFSVLPVGFCRPRTPLELALAPYIHVRFPVISPCAQDGESVYIEELHVAQNWQRCELGSALLYHIRFSPSCARAIEHPWKWKPRYDYRLNSGNLVA